MNRIVEKLIFLGFLCILLVQSAFAQTDSQKLKTNLENLNVLLDASFELLGDRLILNRDKVYLMQINHTDFETESYFRSRIKSRFPEYKIISDVNLGYNATILIDSLKLDTKYLRFFEKNILGDKYIQRQTSVRYNCVFLSTDIEGFRFSQNFIDDFLFDDLSMAESSNHFFAQGIIPSQSFFSKYLVPSIVVLASAAAVILFFTIRNK